MYLWCTSSSLVSTLFATVSYRLHAHFSILETAGRSLEDMDVVFALAYNEGVSPVGVSLRKDVPLAGSPEADIILGITSKRRTVTGSVHEDQHPEKGEQRTD